jgi:hypothetical protein
VQRRVHGSEGSGVAVAPPWGLRKWERYGARGGVSVA